MGYQTAINKKQTKWIAGMISEAGNTKVRTKINGGTMIDTVTISAANLATTATINGTAYVYDQKTITVTAADAKTVATVNGTAYEANSAAATATKTEIATELAGLILAGEAGSATAVLDGETVVVTNVSAAITIVGTTNCSVAQTSVATSVIATGLASRINTGEISLTCEASDAVITVEANDVETAFTAVGTTNCSVAIVETVASTVDFGLFVVLKDNGDAGLPTVTGDITIAQVLGVSVKNNVIEDEGNGYEVGDMIDYITNGTVIARIPDDVTVAEGDTVYVIHTGDDVGKVSNVNTNATALTGVKFLETASSGLANIQINLP